MSTATLPSREIFARPPVAVRRFTVREYHQLAQSGVLAESERVELLEGWIVPKLIQKIEHALAIENGQAALEAVMPPGWRLRVQLPITTADSEPEPDLAIVRHPRRQRRQSHPAPEDVALVIEVADSSLADDRRLKYRIYARASISEYWIVNLVDRRVEVFSLPSGPSAEPAFAVRHNFGLRKSVPLVIGGKVVATIPVRDLLP
jgi:Uma2 family endonuclease